MATDTECDLLIEATKPAERAAITDIQNRLLADHTGASAQQIAAERKERGSLLAIADRLSVNGHRLRPIDDGIPDRTSLPPISRASPIRSARSAPSNSSRHCSEGAMPERSVPKIVKALLFGLAIIAAALIWEYTPLAGMIDPKAVGAPCANLPTGPGARGGARRLRGRRAGGLPGGRADRRDRGDFRPVARLLCGAPARC